MWSVSRLILSVIVAVPSAVLGQGARFEADAGASHLLAVARSDYESANPGARPGSALANSTAGALAKLCRGEIVLAGVARAANKAERDACARSNVNLIELPVATDSIAVVVNPANTWATRMSLAELKRAWLDEPGKALSWKQINAAWPETPLKLYGPGPRLGLASHVRAVLASSTSESAPSLRADINATDVLSVVAEGVARDRAALGLLDSATYTANMKRVRLVPVDDMPVFPLFVYTSAKALESSDMRGYLDHLLVNGARLAARAGLGAHPPATYEQARRQLTGKQ